MTARLLLGLALGVAIGLFLGEHARALEGLAEVYIRLLQMTVLPYLVVALVLGIGRLDPGTIRPLLRHGLAALLAIWAVTLVVVAGMPVAFPPAESASFFSSALVTPHEPLGLLDLYVPANPFAALANSLVPAVTLFSGVIGVALMGLPDKDRLLDPLATIMRAIERVTGFVVRLAPIGIVPIVAVAAGTLSLEQVHRLEAYVLLFTAAALLLGLVLLPLLVSAVTPFRAGEVLWASRDALLTAFLTSSVFVVLPMLVDRARELADRHGLVDEEARSVPGVLVPIAFNFPTAGKLLTLLFVPFAAWLSGEALGLGAYPPLLGAGLASYFAKAQVALPFLLDLAGVPHDAFQLYIPSAIVTGKFDSAVGAMSLLALALLALAAAGGRLRLGLPRALGIAGATLALVLVTALGARALLGALVDTTYTRDRALRTMHLGRSMVPPVLGRDTLAPPPAGVDALARIRARGILRAGFLPGRMPLAFLNADRQPVGFDVELLAQLAEDLGVGLELVPLAMHEVDSLLAAGVVDLVPGVPHTHHWVRRVRLSAPYMDGTLGLVVPDDRRREFGTVARLRAHDSLRIGLIAEPDLYEDYVRAMLGPVPYRLVQLKPDPDAALGGGMAGVDAVILLAEIGTAWTLLHPAYTVVVPQPVVVRRPLAYATAPASERLGSMLDAWVRLQRARGSIDRAYAWWVLGQGAVSPRPRWSIGHDVLGWF